MPECRLLWPGDVLARPQSELCSFRATRPLHHLVVHAPDMSVARMKRGGTAWPWLLGALGIVVGVAVWRTSGPAGRGPGADASSSGAESPSGELVSNLRAPGVAAEELFGVVGDVAVSPDGRIYVLDVVAKQIGVFSPAGERQATLGRPGRGPGEFMLPVSLAVDQRSNLYALDAMNQRLDVFSGGHPERHRSFPLDFQARDMCFLAGRLYVLGVRDAHLIHEVSPSEGTVVRSFAPDAESRDMLLASYRGTGYLACGPGDEITFLPSLRPEVVRYSASSGSPIASAQIPEYRGLRVTAVANGMRFEAADGERNYYASSIVPLPGGDHLIQVGHLVPRSSTDQEFEFIRSYRMSRADGRIRAISDSLPRLIAGQGDRLFAAYTSPHPAVAVVHNPDLHGRP